MILKTCPKCNAGFLIYNTSRIGLECTNCNNFESLQVQRSIEEIIRENKKKIEFLESYNDFKIFR